MTAVAAQVLASKGVRDSSISDIVKAAGVARGTFYPSFANKDEVILAVAQTVAEQVVEAIATQLSEPRLPATELSLRALGATP